jgi:hypothetical protein
MRWFVKLFFVFVVVGCVCLTGKLLFDYFISRISYRGLVIIVFG